ncbi:exonuclease SbcC [Georgenia satyanarayanai]|uniref:Nuclease SbcCD subunit C n=1 Tax=Georgenia satyanarayanai TaxID=860221 RepID=A0A2Y9AIQ6_9MICO|nr:SMC family ATPase [Georgenia satyanarayanai]PYF99346.1 exonuclease SbcC [Georgenia satyanarayanai]SSA43158.1 exonuclease SbcC [Georgenia satyanarayanai]
MRIHHLSLEAVGPFAGHHEVDLDQLSAGGLFLLEGPTGSGKSTLIDAITFGLYGTLGSPARDDRLPSAHAPGAEPVIEVVFSTGAGIYRVRRTPAFQRPKRRGEGTTRQNATARLWRLESVSDPSGEPLATTTQEVGTEVRRIVRLDRDQFSQTVVLPQGRFSTFLRAKPDERAAVLQDVFGTEVYQRVQDQLVAMARQARGELESVRRDVTGCVGNLGSLLPAEDEAVAALEHAAAELDPAALTEVASAVVARAEGEHEAAQQQREEARAAERAAQQVLDAERDLAQRVRRRRELLAEQELLAQRSVAVAARGAELAAGRRAAVAAGALRAEAAARAAVEQTEERLAQVCTASADGPDADLTELALEALRELVTRLTGERGGLVELLELEAGLAAREAAAEADEAALTERRTALAERRTALAARPGQRERLSEALTRIQREAMSVPAAEAGVATCRTVREAARRVEQHLTELVTAEDAVTAAATRAAAAAQEEQTVRARWIAGMAGSLAAELEPGEPCTVCGGTEHPAPAPRSPEHATTEDVDAAGARRARAEDALGAARETRAQAEARLRAAQEASGGAALADAEESLTAAQEELEDAREAVRLAALREQELAVFDEETAGLREAVSREESSLAAAGEELRGRRAAIATDRERCSRGAAEAGTVAARVRRIESRLGAARLVVDARDAHHAARRRQDESAAALAAALTESGFADAAEAAAAQLSAARMAALEREVTEHGAATARVRECLAEAPIATLTGEEAPRVEEAQAAHAERHAALITATESAGRAADSLSRLRRCHGSLSDVLDRHRAVTERAAPVLRMGELAAAGEGNARATTLSTFVLLRRFEDVVAAANDRLAVMSDGRYSLTRIDEREGRSRKAGLGLAVQDHVTETTRDPHTLSGGETFYVSLCLALGLADVVTSEAGGISLDTLFIDEGFGSLDPHTLDGVLGELSRLQAGGRAVGIVSHVSELKERIADRIEVSHLPSGASTLTVRA